MKANELMLGDLVTFKDCQNDEKPTVIKIWQINRDGHALAFIDGDKALDEIAIDDEVVGIPITPKILEKSDFRKVQDKLGRVLYSIADDYFDLTIDELTDSIWCVEYDNLEAQFPTCRNLVGHVQELQHALRLCGVEKEITL